MEEEQTFEVVLRDYINDPHYVDADIVQIGDRFIEFFAGDEVVAWFSVHDVLYINKGTRHDNETDDEIGHGPDDGYSIPPMPGLVCPVHHVVHDPINFQKSAKKVGLRTEEPLGVPEEVLNTLNEVLKTIPGL